MRGQRSKLSYRHAKLGAAKVKKKNKKTNKKNLEMLRPAHCSVYLLCSQERRKKTHFFFFLFTATNSPVILFPPYEWKGKWVSFLFLPGWGQNLSFALCDNHQLFSPGAHLFFSPGAHLSPTSIFPWEMWTLRNLYCGDKGQKVNLSQHLECWHGTQRPCLIGVMALLPCLIKGPQGDFCGYSHRICSEEWL